MAQRSLVVALIVLLMTETALSKDLLITNDTGTQGKGNRLLEVYYISASDQDQAAGVSTKQAAAAIENILSSGVTEHADFILTLPYAWIKAEEDGTVTQNEKGIADMIAEIKWRFYDADTLSFALKPGISIPTGDAEKGLGTGRYGFNIFFITTKKIKPLAFNLNIAFFRNENTAGERKDLWYGSLSAEYVMRENMLFIVNTGFRRPLVKEFNTPPAFFLAGINYGVTDRFSINLGIKTGLNDEETDISLLSGIGITF